VTPQQQQLLAYLEKLSANDTATLLRFAAFLAQGAAATNASILPIAVSEIPQPKVLARPEQERVVDAIKRLAESYPMLDKKKLLNQTSGLVAEHVMGGKPARLVIDEMEAAFRRAYEHFLSQQQSS
jgi:hypothetical protein